MRKGFANSTSFRWNADASELTSSWPSKSSEVKLTLTRVTSSSVHPKPGYEGTPTDYNTTRIKSSSTQERWHLSSGREILEQTFGTSSLVTLSIYLQKTVGPSMVRNLSCSTCVLSVPIHWQFSLYCYPQLFMFSLTPNLRPVYVVITGPRGHSYQ